MNRIIRIKAEKGFTIIPNVVFNSNLSLRAIGLLTYVLHLPDDWVLYKNWLYENMKEGRDAIKTAWAELEQKGFIKTEREPRGEGGKFGEIRYIVYDCPPKVAENQATGSRQAETRPPETQQQETRPLLSTKKKSTKGTSTKKQSTNQEQVPPGGGSPGSLPGNDQPAKPEEAPPGSAAPPQGEKPATTYQRFIDIYDRWFKKLHDGVPPQYNNGNGNAAKSLITYFRNIAGQKAKASGHILDEAGTDSKALESWQYVLDNWHRLDNFLQGKTRLLDINSNIQNIITQLKNGHSKNKQSGQPTGGQVSTASLAGAIAKHYTGTGSA